MCVYCPEDGLLFLSIIFELHNIVSNMTRYNFVCPGQKEEISGSNSVPASELKEILNLARTQYLKMMDSSLPPAVSYLARHDVTASSNLGKKTTKKNDKAK